MPYRQPAQAARLGHFHEETKGRARHTAWSLEQPRHLFVFGFHGATCRARGNSASGLRRVGSRSRSWRWDFLGWHSQCCVGISSLTPDCLGSGWIRPTLGRRLASPWMRWHAEKFSCGVNAGWFLHFYLRANPGPPRVPPFLPPPSAFWALQRKKWLLSRLCLKGP